MAVCKCRVVYASMSVALICFAGVIAFKHKENCDIFLFIYLFFSWSIILRSSIHVWPVQGLTLRCVFLSGCQTEQEPHRLLFCLFELSKETAASALHSLVQNTRAAFSLYVFGHMQKYNILAFNSDKFNAFHLDFMPQTKLCGFFFLSVGLSCHSSLKPIFVNGKCECEVDVHSCFNN